MGQREYSWSASDSILVGYNNEGSLFINMIDSKENKLVWHSTAQKALRKKTDKDWKEKMRQTITEMFKTFPGNP